ncbi:MAG TPA: hypothetical protein VMF59_06510, partial [Bacteroidota bacterium]|nr:hypothetical protein [Bacteroidota bacterium]
AANPTNPNYTTRVLASLQFRTNAFFGPAPSYCVPGISSDGNWVSYGAPNDSGRWDINFTHISWARPRKIAEIDDLSYGSVNISPAGDKIAVQAGVAPPRLMLLSTVGGEVRLREPDAIEDSIVTFGGWSPDGTRISYVRRPSSHRFEIWSASNEGADKRIEFVDSVAENIYAVCWSPDGKSMAWSREMEGGVELFARQLATGEERQLTFDGKFADEPVWLSNGLILFSSNRSGKQSPWLISERGGEPQGVGALGSEIMYLRASLDGTRVITSEFGGLTEIEVTDLAGSRARTVQLGRFVNARWISFSGDFSRIAYFAGEEPGGMVLYVADGSGGNTRRLASVPGGIFFPARSAFLRTWRTAWSPDNRWIAYVEIATNSNDYGGRDLCVIEADHPNDLRRICRSPARWAWIDSTDLVIQTMDMRIGEYSVHAQAPVRQPRDSVYGKPILGGRYFVHDGESRLGTNYRARWVMTTLGGGGGPSGMHRNILPGEPDVEPSPDGSVWLFVPGGQRWTTVGKPEPSGLWKITLPGLRTERVQRAYSKPLMFTMMSDSAKMIANLTHETTMKLTLIENLFR